MKAEKINIYKLLTEEEIKEALENIDNKEEIREQVLNITIKNKDIIKKMFDD